MAVTNTLRAGVFERDKAICAFSGVSVWILDYGTAPFAQHDWVDHIRPRSRKGNDSIENLVCASHFYNSKKVNNGRDNAYLFYGGEPTEWFFWVHGELSAEQTETLARHAKIAKADWYLNRCLMNLTNALQIDWSKRVVVRQMDYWLGAAHKCLVAWRRISGETGPDTFQDRELVRYPTAPDVQLMLSLTRSDAVGLQRIFRRLAIHYRANASALDAFGKAENQQKRRSILKAAEAGGKATEPLLTALRNDVARLDALPGNA